MENITPIHDTGESEKVSINNAVKMVEIDAVKMVEIVSNRSHSKEDMEKLYDTWSQGNAYEKNVKDAFKAPVVCAQTLERFVDDRKARILDVGAGTGLVGAELWRLGYRNIEALDPSEGMLKQAAEKHVYTKLHKAGFTNNMAGVEQHGYDAVTCSGVLCSSHIDASHMPELVRITRPGGFVIITTGIALLTESAEILREMNKMADEGRWSQLVRETITNYWFEEEGLLFVYRVC